MPMTKLSDETFSARIVNVVVERRAPSLPSRRVIYNLRGIYFSNDRSFGGGANEADRSGPTLYSFCPMCVRETDASGDGQR
jgi:hypothetical protein